jgi:hypothetical protein
VRRDAEAASQPPQIPIFVAVESKQMIHLPNNLKSIRKSTEDSPSRNKCVETLSCQSGSSSTWGPAGTPVTIHSNVFSPNSQVSIDSLETFNGRFMSPMEESCGQDSFMLFPIECVRSASWASTHLSCMPLTLDNLAILDHMNFPGLSPGYGPVNTWPMASPSPCPSPCPSIGTTELAEMLYTLGGAPDDDEE